MPTSRSAAAPGSNSALRTSNQRRVLDALRSEIAEADTVPGESAFAQAELARMTGLAPATVSNIVRDLGAAGLIETVPGSGRRGSSVRLASDAGIVAGVDFGHSHVAVGVATIGGRLITESRRRLDSHRRVEALALASEMLAEMSYDRPPLRQVGLGLPAPVTHGVVRSESVFPGWEGVDTSAVAAEILGAPVVVENDANLGALAEHRHGVARGHDSSVFVKISSGVGAGIMIDNELFRGSAGTAGEIGHLTLDEQGPLCRCGSRGCLEAYTSTGTVLSLMAEQLPMATLDDVVAAAHAGSTAARRALEDAGLHLGWGLASIVNLLNPAIVVIGGDMARAGELVLEAARSGLRRHALDSVTLTPVYASELGERASLLGAVLLAAESIELVDDVPVVGAAGAAAGA